MLYYLLSNSNYISEDENKLVRIIVLGTIIYLVVHGLVISETKLNKYFFVIVGLDITSVYLLNNNNNSLTISKGGDHSVSKSEHVTLNTPLQDNLEKPIQMQDFNKVDIENIELTQNSETKTENIEDIQLDDNDLINQLLEQNDEIGQPQIKQINEDSNDDEIDYSDFEKSL